MLFLQGGVLLLERDSPNLTNNLFLLNIHTSIPVKNFQHQTVQEIDWVPVHVCDQAKR